MSHDPPDPFVDDLRAQLAAASAEANGYAQQASALRRELDEARAARDSLAGELAVARDIIATEPTRHDYESACRLVAQMHAVAIGGKVGDGPRLGVLEDVQSLAADLAEARATAEIHRVALELATEQSRDANLEVGNQMALRDEARRELAASQAQVAKLREILDAILSCSFEARLGAPPLRDVMPEYVAMLAAPAGDSALKTALTEAQRVGRADARAAVIDILNGSWVLSGEESWKPVFEAVREFGARCINRAAHIRDDFRCVESEAVVDAVLRGER